MTVSIKDAGTWKDATVYAKDGGAWKLAEVYIKDAGVWKLVTTSTSPTFAPVPGSYSVTSEAPAHFLVTASVAVSWTWTVSTSGSGFVISTRTQGESATSIEFNLGGSPTLTKSRTVTLKATSGGTQYTWIIGLTATPADDDPPI